MFVEKNQRIIKWQLKKWQRINIDILVTMEELALIYHFIDVNRHDYLNTMDTVQRSKTTKRGKLSGQ